MARLKTMHKRRNRKLLREARLMRTVMAHIEKFDMMAIAAEGASIAMSRVRTALGNFLRTLQERSIDGSQT